jgi:hypothetical protein
VRAGELTLNYNIHQRTSFENISSGSGEVPFVKDHELTQLENRVGELEEGRLTENDDH